ncbi:MAG: hypothetical protein NTW31_00745 [Bacteroidetes bacterium]|nr:hypothetical protein [Bacteroidota bacterium]
MPKSSNQDKLDKFSSEFPFFIYEEFRFSLDRGGLNINFHFNLGDRYHFYPSLFIPRSNWAFDDEVLKPLLPSLVFHIGMIELISYWKTACPPKLIIKPAGLTPEQKEWWKKLYFLGLGEFFYLNSISTNVNSFMEIEVEGEDYPSLATPDIGAGLIVPLGGGKDSAVTLDLLKTAFDTLPLVLNARGATSGVIDASEITAGKTLLISRSIDPLLLEMNAMGFLNGHTPFSALLAFISLTAALLTGRKFIVLSNESSANEATIPGTNINHQYSKSLEFEDDFRFYVSKYITHDIEYFSFLRPLNELQIALLFSRLPAYHDVFRSCNAGSKTDTWCCNCPKCLFTFIILAPFFGLDRLNLIFGKNLLDQPAMSGMLRQFTGAAEEKPFDCIGTISEVNLALCEAVRMQGARPLPALLQLYRGSAEFEIYRELEFCSSLESWLPNNLQEPFGDILKKALYA